MKKIFLSLLLLLFVTNVYAIDLIPKLSICLPGTFRSDYEVDTAFSLGGEARIALSEYFTVGVGADYLFNRRLGMGKKAAEAAAKGEFVLNQYYTGKQFSMVPVYASIILFPFGNFGEYKPYLRIDGGYNVLFSIDDGKNSSGGVYYAGAIGFELYDRYIMEVYTSRYEAKDNDKDITYKNIYFKVGYKFSL